jgi:hypothetical protein
MFFGKKSRSLTLLAEGYLTRGARRWSWTILEVEFYTILLYKKASADYLADAFCCYLSTLSSAEITQPIAPVMTKAITTMNIFSTP